MTGLAADKAIMIAVGIDPQVQPLCDLLACPDLAADERYATNLARVRHKDMLVPLLQERIAGWMARDLQAHLEAAGPINGFDEVMDDAQFKARHLRRSVTHARVGEMDVIANPIVFPRPQTPWTGCGLPRPCRSTRRCA